MNMRAITLNAVQTITTVASGLGIFALMARVTDVPNAGLVGCIGGIITGAVIAGIIDILTSKKED